MTLNGRNKIILIVAALAFCALCALAIPAAQMYVDRKLPCLGGNVELYIKPSAGIDSVKTLILSSGKVTRPRSLARSLATVDTIRPGHYTATASSSGMYMARMLENGWQSPVNLVLSGTMRTQGGIAKKISSQLLLDSLSVIVAMRDSALLSKYGFTPEDVFSLFVPDTYQMYWTDSMEKVFDKQKSAYDRFWSDENRSKASREGLTPEQVSVLASIVNGETNYEKEMPAIAGVYLNRLREGILLQADPTVAFCFGYKLNRILIAHTMVDSPYNTYRHAGLPPGPICVPTKAALTAVLNPDKHNYLFFCASPEFNGTHVFASTYPEHLKNARAYQKALNERKK